MAARVARHMSLARASILVFIVVALLTALFMIKMSQGEALPASPTDSTKVPHYFGPWTNWALSPLTLPDADRHHHRRRHGRRGDRHGGRQRRRHRHHHHQPGQRLRAPARTVAHQSANGTGAAATATITNSGAIVAVDRRHPRAAATRRRSSPSPAAARPPTPRRPPTAASTRSRVQNAGTGYQFPTVDFDMPDDPNGTKATAHAVKDANGAITGDRHRQPGLGLR